MFGACLQEGSCAEDAGLIEALAHSPSNTGDVFKGDVFKRAGHIFGVPDGGAIWFVQFASDFGQLPVCGYANRAGDVRADMIVNAFFDIGSDKVWSLSVVFIKFAGELINGFDGFYWGDGHDLID